MAEKKLMTKTERNDLVKIIDGRFQVLFEDLAQREREIAEAIRANIVAEHEEAIREADDRHRTLRDELQVLHGRTVQLIENMRERGVEPRQQGQAIIDGPSFRDVPIWQPADIDRKVRAEIDRLKVESGLASTNLRRQQLDLKERLLVETLETEHAKGFLDRIPELDQLLPRPAQVLELEETNGG